MCCVRPVGLGFGFQGLGFRVLDAKKGLEFRVYRNYRGLGAKNVLSGTCCLLERFSKLGA